MDTTCPLHVLCALEAAVRPLFLLRRPKEAGRAKQDVVRREGRDKLRYPAAATTSATAQLPPAIIPWQRVEDKKKKGTLEYGAGAGAGADAKPGAAGPV